MNHFQDGQPVDVQASGIIDTGALVASYINIPLANKLKRLGYHIDTSIENNLALHNLTIFKVDSM